MSLHFEEKRSDSPYVERIWRCHSEYPGSFSSIAALHWEMVVSKYQGRTMLTVRGPETRATRHDFPAEVEWFGIDFKLGTFMPSLPPALLVDHRDVSLPEATSQSFWLYGSAWQFPTYENVDTFINRLVREDLLICDPVVDTVLRGHRQTLSPRTIQGRFAQATGLTQRSIQQIKRARHAAALLRQGVSILDTIDASGYFDQPHMTRALKQLIGYTPAQFVWADIISLSEAEGCVNVQDSAPLSVL